ncbi:glycogen debranching enzyme GlgX, partial [Pseudomonas cichorii]|nr:glycogen debranching enzyme GlgX [Pseudomonas cichorii]
QWHDSNARCLGMLMDGRAQETGIRRPGADATLLLMVNAHHEGVDFTFPQVPEGTHFTCLIDTNQEDLRSKEQFDFGSRYTVTPRSLLLFELQREDQS